MIGSKSSTINLNYTRFEKDGYIMGDGINMTYDLNTGKIAGFNLNCTQIQLPDYKSFADEAKVLDKIFTQNKIELSYKPFFNESTQSYDLKLYYSATEKPNLPLMFSAITGERIINQVQVDKINYSDIDQSRYQNEINALSNLGIGFTGGNGGELAELCEICINVPSEVTARIQEGHILLGHWLCDELERRCGDVSA